MSRLNPEHVLDCREGFVEGLGDLGAVLKLHVIVDLPSQQIQPTGFSRLVGSANRSGEMGYGVKLADFGIVRSFGLGIGRELSGPFELPPLQGHFRLLEFRRHDDRDHQGRGSLKGARSAAGTFIRPAVIRDRMRDAEAFEGIAFVGLARAAKRDPYRLSLFAQHLEPDERPLILLPIQGGTLLVTDGRLLEFRAHLEVHGAWNVKEFQGYVVHRAIDRRIVRDVVHDVQPVRDATGNRRVEDRLVVSTEEGSQEFLVSRGPEPTLSEEDFNAVRAAFFVAQAK